MKFIRYCLIFSVFFLLLISSSSAQDEGFYRVQSIERKLLQLSDSIMPGLKETANFSVSNASMQDFLRGVSATHNLNISIDPSIDARITNNFTNVQVVNLLVFLCKEYQLDIRFTGSILAFYRYNPPTAAFVALPPKRLNINYDPAKDLLTVDLKNDSIISFAKQATQITKKNIVLSPGLQGRLLNGYIESLPFNVALDKIAYSNNLRLLKTEDRTFVLAPVEDINNINNPTNPERRSVRPARQNDLSNPSSSGLFVDVRQNGLGQKLVTIDAVNVPIVDIINNVSEKTNQEYILFSDLKGNTTASVREVLYDDFLEYLLKGTTHSYKKQDSIYLIGERNLEGLRTSKLVKMQFRSVDTLESVIPQELKKGVEIKTFKELNSVILSGGTPQVNEIIEFLKALDQPVVNVLIEVIVVDVRKNNRVETGIKAGLADSAVSTRGGIFPGFDLTLGSNTINALLGKLPNGFDNIGKVTPNFYVALKALEDNKNINIRSTPKLATLNGHKATLVIGQKVYFLQQTQSIIPGVNPIQTSIPEYRSVEANLSIDINPLVSGDDNITLNIVAEFSDFIPATIPNAPPGNATRKFTSMVRVKNEEMIVLGGLEEARKENSGSGTPVLSRIPVLKWLFSSRVKDSSNNRLIVFIKPTIVY